MENFRREAQEQDELLQILEQSAKQSKDFGKIEHARQWNVHEVCWWLISIGMEQYIFIFYCHNIDGNILLQDMTESMLIEDLNVKKIHSHKIMRAALQLKTLLVAGDIDTLNEEMKNDVVKTNEEEAEKEKKKKENAKEKEQTWEIDWGDEHHDNNDNHNSNNDNDVEKQTDINIRPSIQAHVKQLQEELRKLRIENKTLRATQVSSPRLNADETKNENEKGKEKENENKEIGNDNNINNINNSDNNNNNNITDINNINIDGNDMTNKMKQMQMEMELKNKLIDLLHDGYNKLKDQHTTKMKEQQEKNWRVGKQLC